MEEREQLSRELLTAIGLDEQEMGDAFKDCFQEAMEMTDDELRIIVRFYRLMKNKDQEPEKWQNLMEYLGGV